MKSAFRKLLFTLVASAFLAASVVAGEYFIKDGDRVVFLGDSNTEQRLYTTYIEAYTLTRHPDWKLWFRNVGWGGDTSWLRQRAHPDEKQLFAADEASRLGYPPPGDPTPPDPYLIWPEVATMASDGQDFQCNPAGSRISAGTCTPGTPR
jgi:hypothetical protein